MTHIVQYPQMNDGRDKLSNIDTGRRLRILRQLQEMNQTLFAAQFNVSQSLWSQYEKGERQLTPQVALKLCQRYLVSMDWLYRGYDQMLPKELARELEELSSQLDETG